MRKKIMFFFIPSIQAKIFPAKIFSRNENIVSRKEFLKKVVIFIDMVKSDIVIF